MLLTTPVSRRRTSFRCNISATRICWAELPVPGCPKSQPQRESPSPPDSIHFAGTFNYSLAPLFIFVYLFSVSLYSGRVISPVPLLSHKCFDRTSKKKSAA